MDAKLFNACVKAGDVLRKCVEDLREKSQENLDWLNAIKAEVEKQTSKSSFLLPKTPKATRTRRKRVNNLPPICSYDEAENVEPSTSTSSESYVYSTRPVRSTRTTRNTRNTRTTEQNAGNVASSASTSRDSLGYSTRTTRGTRTIRNTRNTQTIEKNEGNPDHESALKPSRKASKVAGNKIKENLRMELQQASTEKNEKESSFKFTLDHEMAEDNQESSNVLRENVVVRGASLKRTSEREMLEDGQRPSKIMRLAENVKVKSMFPLVEKLVIRIDGDSDSDSQVVSSSQMEDGRDVNEPVRNSLTTLDKTKNCLNKANEETQASISDKCKNTPLIESTQDRGSNRRSSRLSNIICTSVNNSVTTESSRHSLQSRVIDTTYRNSSEYTSHVKETPNTSVRSEKNVANFTFTLESKKQDLTFVLENSKSNSEPVQTEMDTSGMNDVDIADDVKITETPVTELNHSTRRSSRSKTRVSEKEEAYRSTESPVLTSSKKTSRFGLQSTPIKKLTKSAEKKKAEVFSPYANEPVRERVAAFERLRTVSEEQVEIKAEAEVPQMRVTRTKTRAMAKAEAAAATTSTTNTVVPEETQNAANKELNKSKNIYSKNSWKTSRKSLAKAKMMSVAKEKRQKDINEESEMSKENSMVLSSSKYNTPHYRNTPLASSNISNISGSSGNRLFTFGGSSSKGRYLVNKIGSNIVVGVESFITKQNVKPTLDEIRELKEEDLRRRKEREEEAARKREEAIKRKMEEKKRKREEKMLKVLKQREAMEKQKMDSELRQQKEKEEKLKQAMQEREDKMKEQAQQKKQLQQQKVADIEIRRKQEEIARLAKLKEQEEEQRRIQAAKKKEQEEQLRRQVEEKEAAALREQQAAKLYQIQAKMMKEKQMKVEVVKANEVANKALDKAFAVPTTFGKSKVPNPNDYGIDSSCGEESNDEERPKRPIPEWARRASRMPVLKAQVYKFRKIYDLFFTCEETTPDLTRMFRHYSLKQKKRTSSAVWRTPPRYSELPKYY